MGNIVASIATPVAIAVILPLVFNLFWFLKRREEKKQGVDNLNRTRAPKFVLVFFLGFSILCIVGMIVAVVFIALDGAPAFVYIIIVVCCLLFASLGFLGFTWSRFRYEIIEEDGITLVRFNKRRKVYYSDIAYYKFSEGMAGMFITYDERGIVVFDAEAINIGCRKLADAMQQHGVTQVIYNFPTPEMRNTKEYKYWQKKKQLPVFAWLAFGVGILMIGSWGLVYGIIGEKPEFENYEVTGIVENYEFKEEALIINLKDDDGFYWVGSLGYKKLNSSIKNVIKENTEINLLIGYKDDRDRFCISQIEIDGEIYLNAADTEQAEIDDHNLGMSLMWIFLGGAVALLVTWASLLIYKKVKFDGKEKEDGRKEL